MILGEKLLNYASFKLDVSTFRFEHRGDIMIAEEKPLGQMLSALEEEISENDIWLIRFLLNQKGGYNLRNRVAHGLLDGREYGFFPALAAFTVLLRLSNYGFTIEDESKAE